ncbi:aminoglycoside phosphotransferase family protein [Streptomyces sp. B6B3]|uniref:aminoglycoside phosphotransferase family protein n=1 Tax=Streptomyces sp. B6B3 TaxID=3153570 RepID=UPI00325C4321
MIVVPEALAEAHAKYEGEAGRAWIAALPGLAATMLERWDLTPTGPGRHGVAALVLPVTRASGPGAGTRAALKLQPATGESVGEPSALRAWRGDGAVRLLEHDPASGTMLLEALDPSRSLDDVPDVMEALAVLAGLMARLVAAPPPPGLRRLGDMTAGMLDRVRAAAPRLADPAHRRLLTDWAAAVREVADEPGGALLHWDLHYQNVLAPLPGARAAGREPWLAIDPKPLLGDPCFELLPALWNRFVPDAADVLRRFDLMTETVALDRQRAVRWTLGRILQNSLWLVEGGETTLPADHTFIADSLLARR